MRHIYTAQEAADQVNVPLTLTANPSRSGALGKPTVPVPERGQDRGVVRQGCSDDADMEDLVRGEEVIESARR